MKKSSILMLIVGLVVGLGLTFGVYYFFFRNETKVMECPKCEEKECPKCTETKCEEKECPKCEDKTISYKLRNRDVWGNLSYTPYGYYLDTNGDLYLTIGDNSYDGINYDYYSSDKIINSTDSFNEIKSRGFKKYNFKEYNGLYAYKINIKNIVACYVFDEGDTDYFIMIDTNGVWYAYNILDNKVIKVGIEYVGYGMYVDTRDLENFALAFYKADGTYKYISEIK